ncbi:MAG: Holliday junction branch migration protein RuvA [Bacteroidaceae bacterium]|jgi:Holliday junction DNA helicase RuvA|nr:Holliday junction branch migration protein RuvA [Bacteroidaceae bacterium]MEE0985845.1 Holliday junction branch migration protein RuvA [Bacteroidaceae bacterium]
MIEYLRGKLAELEPTMATVDCMGVGYGVNITLNTYAAIQGKEDVKLWIYESIREDAYQLWGFSTKVEREVFLLLITVSGIGANTARMILSALSPQELCNIISSGNAKMLTQVKGIGPKAAQRIIVDLGDKIMALAADASMPQGGGKNTGVATMNNEVMDEAIQALTMLGFSPAPTSKVVSKILTDEPSAPVEKVIKLALKML